MFLGAVAVLAACALLSTAVGRPTDDDLVEEMIKLLATDDVIVKSGDVGAIDKPKNLLTGVAANGCWWAGAKAGMVCEGAASKTLIGVGTCDDFCRRLGRLGGSCVGGATDTGSRCASGERCVCRS